MKGKDTFDIKNMYTKSTGLSWKSCDGTPSMTGCLKGFVSYVKKQNENFLLTQCLMHLKVFIVKSIGLGLLQVLNEII